MAGNIGSLLALEELKKRGLVGMGETALNFGTSAIAEPIAGLSGLLSLPLGHERATQVINNTRDKLTYQPRSEMGKRMTGYVGEAMQPVAEGFEYVSSGLGDTVTEATGSELAGTVAYTVPTAIGAAIGYKTLPKGGKGFEIGDIKSGGNKQRGTFGGVKAKNANLEMQAAAEELSNRGVPRETIWKETGWFKGADGKWRFEIDDSSARYTPLLHDSDKVNKSLQHEPMFNAYPEIGEMPLQKTFERDLPYRKYADGSYRVGEFQIKDDLGREKGASVLLHESQHGIQDIEGFAKGGFVRPQEMITKDIKSETKNLNALKRRKKNGEDVDEAIKKSEQKLSQLDDEMLNPDLTYLQLAGEAEARNVQTRLRMSPQERIDNPPWTTLDVPEKDLISKGVSKDGINFKKISEDEELKRIAKLDEDYRLGRPMSRRDKFQAKQRAKRYAEELSNSESGKSMSIEQQMAREELKRRGIIAYHGTPHEVDKFSSQYIGTGEGAQAYGHGLYFAEHPETAIQYKENLSDAEALIKGQRLRDFVKSQDVSSGAKSLINNAVNSTKGFTTPFDINEAKKNLQKMKKEALEKAPENKKQSIEKAFNEAESVLNPLGISDTAWGGSLGNLYKVELDIDPDTEMLDWDKPLSEQPKVAQEVILRLAKTYRKGATRGGVTLAESEIKRNSSLGEIHKALEGQIDGMGWGKGRPDVIASELNKNGIKGIKYSDQMSRGAEGGTSNFVIFDDNLITIAEKNGVKFEQVEKLAKEKNISKQQALSMLIGGSIGAALWSSGDNKPDRS